MHKATEPAAAAADANAERTAERGVGGARNCKALHGMKRLRERKGTSNRILDLPEKKGRKKRDEKTPAQICNWGKKYTLWFADIPGNSLEKFCKLATGKSISKLR